MKISKAIEICLDYHRNYSKPATIRSYESILTKFGLIFGDKDLEEVSSEFSPIIQRSLPVINIGSIVYSIRADSF